MTVVNLRILPEPSRNYKADRKMPHLSFASCEILSSQDYFMLQSLLWL